ncbi:YqhG family protein [Salipaludibacillus daqingensis]|uniref:YqhG family protein n=1 Tax=Salipaludibacillus daqingensis TaxID=3041001 RepID=UPI002476B6C3|nr:YqhG family protein [Salipaludibacillus daqingensis]
MHQADIHGFLKDFFIEYDCEVTDFSDSSLEVQLTAEIDKAIMNRPFYWHYIEKMNGLASPMRLTFETDSTAKKSKQTEVIHYGSPRLHQLFSFAMSKGKYGHFYEKVEHAASAQSLKPWLALNGKLVYQCHKKKEEFFSIGLNLINGEMINDFHFLLKHWEMNETISSLCFPLSPLIRPASGLQRIKDQLIKKVHTENHQWAVDAKQKMEEDLLLLERFYEEIDEKPDCYKNEKNAIITQYEPSIHLNIINGGLFYLSTHPLDN